MMKIQEESEKFAEESKAIKFQKGLINGQDLSEMKDVMSEMPEYKETVKKLLLHKNLANRAW